MTPVTAPVLDEMMLETADQDPITARVPTDLLKRLAEG
jgi:hypothetical protein